jgi:signal transduction histidine kinase
MVRQIIKRWLSERILLSKYKSKVNHIDLLRKLEKLEKQVSEQSEQLEQAKISFLKNLYHEIRTPLNAIVGFNNLLLVNKELVASEQEEYHRLINNSSADFLKVMDTIIQASLLEAGMIEMKRNECKIRSILDEAYAYCSLKKRIAEKNNIALLKSMPRQLEDIEIICDKFYLVQVLNYLIENALKFTEKGVVEFGVTSRKHTLEFFVKDSGIGNLKGKENYLFERFTKVDVSDGSKRGLGLGLSNSKKIVELMHGEIWFDDIPDKGTCFYFTIPYLPIKIKGKRKKEHKNFGFLEGVFQ